MKIKVSLCTKDQIYSEKLVYYFNSHYFDKFSWDIYTHPSYLIRSAASVSPDIILVGEEWREEMSDVLSNMEGEWVYACLVENLSEDGVSVLTEIEKYCRADKIYRELLELYSQVSGNRYFDLALINGKTEIYAFVSASGGAGASTIASAAAKSYARFEKILYINLESMSAMGLVFDGQGELGFDDIIYVLKSRRKTLQLKIESAVSRDRSGAYFFAECKNPLDLQELTQDDFKELLTAIQAVREYDKVILDVGNQLLEKEVAAMSFASRIVVVVNKDEAAERKLERYLMAVQAIEEQRKTDICSKMTVFYNKIQKNMQLPEQISQIRVSGGFPKIENGTYEGIIEKLANLELAHNI